MASREQKFQLGLCEEGIWSLSQDGAENEDKSGVVCGHRGQRVLCGERWVRERSRSQDNAKILARTTW